MRRGKLGIKGPKRSERPPLRATCGGRELRQDPEGGKLAVPLGDLSPPSDPVASASEARNPRSLPRPKSFLLPANPCKA